MNCLLASELLPSSNDNVAVKRIDLYETRRASSFLASYQRASAASERVQDNVTAFRTIHYGIGDQVDWFAGRMHR